MRKDEYANDECLAPDVKRNRFVYGPRFCFGFAPEPILLDCHHEPVQLPDSFKASLCHAPEVGARYVCFTRQ